MVLKKLKLENFSMYGNAEFDFYNRTKITAKNGKGKTSIANAYMWLLFNCDYKLTDNPVVRREIGGEAVKDVDVSVTGTFDINGTDITVKKIQKRKYSKDGTSYKDDNSYFINDVPKTLTAYNEYLGISKEMRMCCNINAFLNQKPADMRDYLFSTIESISDLEIAKKNPDLSELALLLGKYTTEELFAMNKKIVSDVKKELPVIDGQIKEKERDISVKNDIDVAEIELIRNSLKELLERNIESQTNVSCMTESAAKIGDEIIQLKFQLSELQNGANEALTAKRSELRNYLRDREVELETIGSEINRKDNSRHTNQINLENASLNRKTLADMWLSVNNEKFDESTTVCPTCNRKLAKTKIDSLRKKFEESKQKLLHDIAVNGQSRKEEIEQFKEAMAASDAEIKELLEKKELIQAEIDAINQQLDVLPMFVDISDREYYKAILSQIKTKEAEMNRESDITEMLKAMKEEETDLRNKIKECDFEIESANTEKDETRLSELRSNRLKMVQNQSDAEKVLYLLNELSKAKNEALSDAINSKFFLVKWKLWELNKSGEYKNVCVPMVDGKSILSTMSNKGNQILGKIDICNSIQKISGIKVPVWLDDCEALDDENSGFAASLVDSQIIMLKVTENEKLSISRF